MAIAPRPAGAFPITSLPGAHVAAESGSIAGNGRGSLARCAIGKGRGNGPEGSRGVGLGRARRGQVRRARGSGSGRVRSARMNLGHVRGRGPISSKMAQKLNHVRNVIEFSAGSRTRGLADSRAFLIGSPRHCAADSKHRNQESAGSEAISIGWATRTLVDSHGLSRTVRQSSRGLDLPPLRGSPGPSPPRPTGEKRIK